MKTFFSIFMRVTILGIFMRVAILWAVLAGFSSCFLYDDLDDCPAIYYNTSLLVRFDPTMYELPDNEHSIDNVHVYVFDGNDRFVTAWNGGGYDYSSGTVYEVPFELLEGEYQFVVWTNHDDNSYKFSHAVSECQPNITTLQQLQLYLECSGDIDSDIPDLHYGITRNAGIGPKTSNTHTVSLIPNTYRINVTVKGLPETSDEYAFTITENNSHFTFDNSIVSGKNDFNHIRTCRFENRLLNASMRVLSLTDDRSFSTRAAGDRSPQLTFANVTNPEDHYSGDMVRLIRKAYESAGRTVDFDVTYKFDIELSYNSEMEITISVNGWSYTYNPTDL